MSVDDGFLARWSRRKLDGKGPASAPAAEDAALPEQPPASIPEGEPPPLSPDEIAGLPKLEDLTAESDIGPFLRSGVPGFLRNAALRRMWSLDPSVRDYVGDARDYAYDWHVPGGVPGSGTLPSTDEIQATVSRMFSRAPQGEGEHVHAGPAEPREGPSVFQESAPLEGAAPLGTVSDEAQPLQSEFALAETSPEAKRAGLAAEPAATAQRRRHGGAFPA